MEAKIQFDLPEEVINDLEKELREKKGGAKIAGPVPMKQVLKDGEDGIASFKIVSSINKKHPKLFYKFTQYPDWFNSF